MVLRPEIADPREDSARELVAAYRALIKARLYGTGPSDVIHAWDRCSKAADAVEDAFRASP